MKTAHVVISGYVQGVGFRQFVKSEAEKLHIRGWVRNTEEEQVEVLMQGEQEYVEQLIQFCRKGPMLSNVKHVYVQWHEVDEEYSAFEIW